MSLPFYPQPKPAPRLLSRILTRRAEAKAWQACCRIVDARDGWHCRVCRRRVLATLTLCPERLEHHHLAPRSRAPLLIAEPRNCLSVCSQCHQALTNHELTVIGGDGDYFIHQGGKYLNADRPLRFARHRSL